MTPFEISCINILLLIGFCELVRLIFTLRSYIRSKKNDKCDR